VSGKLIMNALVMYDHQSDTLWSQFLSQGVKGPLLNKKLEIVPAVQTTDNLATMGEPAPRYFGVGQTGQLRQRRL